MKLTREAGTGESEIDWVFASLFTWVMLIAIIAAGLLGYSYGAAKGFHRGVKLQSYLQQENQKDVEEFSKGAGRSVVSFSAQKSSRQSGIKCYGPRPYPRQSSF